MKKQSWIVSLIVVFLIWNVVQSVAFRSSRAAVFPRWTDLRPPRVELVVRRGDSLADLTYRINDRYGTRLSLWQIKRSSSIRYAHYIRPGMSVSVPVLDRAEDRRAAIARGEAALFRLKSAGGREAKPVYELPEKSEVRRYDYYIRRSARRHGMDVDLVRAIVYMETTHGWYDEVTGLLIEPQSLRPMNVNVAFWGEAMGVTRDELLNPRVNVETGVRILRGIRDRLADPDVRSIATLYNNLAAEHENDYGARVETIYKKRLWRTR